MSETQVISSLYLPIVDAKLLLPNVNVAEVIEYVKPSPKENVPSFYLGDIEWRGIELPLISFELVTGKEAPERNPEIRIAVLNSVGTDNKALPFLGLLTQGLPRLVKVSSDLVQEGENTTSPAELGRVKVDGEDAIIPNLEHLEEVVLSLQKG